MEHYQHHDSHLDDAIERIILDPRAKHDITCYVPLYPVIVEMLSTYPVKKEGDSLYERLVTGGIYLRYLSILLLIAFSFTVGALLF